MNERGDPPLIFYILLVACVVLGSGYWYLSLLRERPGNDLQSPSSSSEDAESSPPQVPSPPSSVPTSTTVSIDGSPGMMTINQQLKSGFEGQYPGVTVKTMANGSEQGIRALISGSIDIAAISRPLTPQEQEQGLIALPISLEEIAIVVDVENPFQGGLSVTQVADIFQGKLTNWSAVGGSNAPIRVIHHPSSSSTRQAFQTLLLQEGNFGNTPNTSTLPSEEKSALFSALAADGISYINAFEVLNQESVRTVPLNGIKPGRANYPLQRKLYYVYQEPPSIAVRAFLGYATSP
ncbi:substrate-binding domain-containing protein [Lyngbya aestuarii]|uniref:substrate-binding domain-containing protein n=1 Tax=Lyngbya aestuarii TaxID=118322 RepID=UPI00403E1948